MMEWDVISSADVVSDLQLLDIFLYLQTEARENEIRTQTVDHLFIAGRSKVKHEEIRHFKKSFRYKNALKKALAEDETLQTLRALKEQSETALAAITSAEESGLDEEKAQAAASVKALVTSLEGAEAICRAYETDLPLLRKAKAHSSGRLELVRAYKKSLAGREKKHRREEREELLQYLEALDVNHYFADHVEAILSSAIATVRTYLESQTLYRLKYTESGDQVYTDRIPLQERYLTPFLEWAIADDGFINEDLVLMAFATGRTVKGSAELFLLHFIAEHDEHLADRHIPLPGLLLEKIEASSYPAKLLDDVRRTFTEVKLGEALSRNPYYSFFNRNFIQAARRVAREKRQRLSLQKRMLSEIPDNYIDFYPEARQMQRHFILHVGPTNSGKTYDAIEALSGATYGIYLAPLRLLAYEQFENLNRRGVPCSLVTSEERILVDGAEHQSSTVELANFKRFYDVAVIDEAQMITDEERGGHWTAAILGLLAYEIHVCMAPHAEEIVKKLITDCNDTYEVVYHHRQTPLIMEDKPFVFPDSVRPGDALIVFSKRNVHAVASELSLEGWKSSIIYGALPYDVRHREAERFSSGETQIVVATDAIGMGLNLPVQRIVFLETDKFNGRTVRPLQSSEIQQIAGRAGRFGMFPQGLVSTFKDDMAFIGHGLTSTVPPITDAMLSFPEALLTIDAKVSRILSEWNDMAASAGFLKATVKTQISLAEHLESYTTDKELIYSLITIPFDERDNELYDLWSELSLALIRRKDLYLEKRLAETTNGLQNMTVSELEHAYSLTDLLFGFATRSQGGPELDLAFMEAKRRISEAIMALLSEAKLQKKTCRVCGRPISWSYPYTICHSCFRKRTRM